MEVSKNLLLLILTSLLLNLPTTKAQNCPLVFTSPTDNSISRGPVATSDTTRINCESTCRQDSKCVSYQINTRPGESFCWIQSGENMFAIENLYTTENIIEFRKSRDCSLCVSTYNQLTGISLSVTPLRSIIDAATCQRECDTTPTCLSYQINTNPSSYLCGLQLTSLDKTQLLKRPNVVEFERVYDCSMVSDCAPVFDSGIPTLISPGATPQMITDQSVCANNCLLDASCLSYQFVYNLLSSNLCYFQTDISKFSNKIQRTGFIEFIKNTTYCYQSTLPAQKAVIACPIVFQEKANNNNSFFASPNTTFTTIEACRQACFNDNQCVSYQWNSIANEIDCWFQFQARNLATDRTYLRPGVTEFLKLRFCNITTITVFVSSTNTEPIVNITTPDDFFNNNTNQASLGATLQYFATEAECKVGCFINTNCWAYQIDRSATAKGLCWFQLDQGALKDQFQRIGVTEHIKVCKNKFVTTTTVSLCEYDSLIYFIKISSSLSEPQTFATAAECKAGCHRNTNCWAYQIDRSETANGLCWFHLISVQFQRSAVTEHTERCTNKVVKTTTASSCIQTIIQ